MSDNWRSIDEAINRSAALQGTRPGWRVLRMLVGAFCAGSLTWIFWGLASGGDFFGGGSWAVVVTLIVATFIGGLVGARVRSRRAQIGLAVGAVFCAFFWFLAPNGWWAVAPPPP